MTLRNRLFLSTSALLTVALLGLLLGIFSVLQLTKAQNQLMKRNLSFIDATMGMGEEIGNQTILMISESLDREALRISDENFRRWLDRARASSVIETDQAAVEEIAESYNYFSGLLARPFDIRRQLLRNNQFGQAVEAMRDHINAVQLHYVAEVEKTEADSRERAWLMATLLGLIGVAILLIGFVTAHSIAQRFARPIEALARAADQIGRGDFKVILPLSPIAELSALSRRFGLMAEAVREFKHSNVEALQAEQRRLQAVLDSINDGLLIIGRSGMVEHFNPVAQRQLGWNEAHLGQSLGDALQLPELEEQLQQVLNDGLLADPIEDLQIEANGETRLLCYSLTPVSHEAGQRILGAVMVLRDVTEQRAFERVRSEFVLRASHELRTPVTGMHMAFSLLQEHLKSLGPRQADLLNTVDEEMRRLVKLINDLLNFSRYQNGVQKIELHHCDVHELLLHAQQRLQTQASETNVSLKIELHETLPLVSMDRLQIERVLDNLIGNALRHSESGGQITLQAWRQGERVIISVKDNGEGIPYSQQARVFEPFVQIGRKKGGAGLGLALCKEIVQLHGGHIGVHSKPEQGAQFYLALPL
ncbi:MAG TPA: HAMP domain-containing protein [Pseudomonas xinjiangensis]|uniref:histidine kinase n=2 Tax=root TaxID=1 RepID=A0A7V1BQU5_9GAMM|nr:HAMP domain-containing protein [Halopseudomonas xinjiangensis]HEC46273.1 HAMP domain-containing protein [Halopseudomonas xinjiangensis]